MSFSWIEPRQHKQPSKQESNALSITPLCLAVSQLVMFIYHACMHVCAMIVCYQADKSPSSPTANDSQNGEFKWIRRESGVKESCNAKWTGLMAAAITALEKLERSSPCMQNS
jgi:hypothetical protein